MQLNSLGDLALNFQLRRQNADLKNELGRLSQELSTGVTSDINSRLRGNFSPLAGLERGISISNSYLVGIAERGIETSALQSSLQKLRDLGQISGALLTVQETGDPAQVRNAGYDAQIRFDAAISTLNTQVGGRSIFSGIETDLPSVARSDTIFSALEAEIALAGAGTATEIATVVNDWFAPGGGFDATGYTGGTPSENGYKLSDGEVAPPLPTAEEESIRANLAGLAIGGLIGRGALSADPAEQGLLARQSAEKLLAADSRLVELQARVGIDEQQIARAETEVKAELSALEIAKSELISVDPFETAVKLQNAETQLQTLYSVTAKLSRLSLTNYL